MKPVNLKILSNAFLETCDDYDFQYRSFVDKRNGKIYQFAARHLAIAGFYSDGGDYEAMPFEQDEIAEAKAFTDRYDPEHVIPFPNQCEMRDTVIMEDYAQTFTDARIANQLLSALRGRSKFRRFKDTVSRLGVIEDWYEYKNRAELMRTRRWCIINGVDYEPKIAYIGDFEIRPATTKDLCRINKVYDIARDYMVQNGNASQWSGGYPWAELLANDIMKQQLFVMIVGGVIRGVFAFIIGVDPTYVEIEDGKWLNDKAYGAIHRLASDGKSCCVFEACLSFCLEQVDNIRIDTHADNAKMRALLEKNGFVKCGTIHVHDGLSDHSPRIAYQYKG
jgi:hypothetical protein